MRSISALMLTTFITLSVYAGDRINISPQDIDFLSIEFGEVSVGKSSQVQIGLNAPKDKALTISELSIAGDMFSATTNCGNTVAAGKYCAININYAPKTTGDHYGEMGIKTSEGNILLRLYGAGLK